MTAAESHHLQSSIGGAASGICGRRKNGAWCQGPVIWILTFFLKKLMQQTLRMNTKEYENLFAVRYSHYGVHLHPSQEVIHP